MAVLGPLPAPLAAPSCRGLHLCPGGLRKPVLRGLPTSRPAHPCLSPKCWVGSRKSLSPSLKSPRVCRPTAAQMWCIPASSQVTTEPHLQVSGPALRKSSMAARFSPRSHLRVGWASPHLSLGRIPLWAHSQCGCSGVQSPAVVGPRSRFPAVG